MPLRIHQSPGLYQRNIRTSQRIPLSTASSLLAATGRAQTPARATTGRLRSMRRTTGWRLTKSSPTMIEALIATPSPSTTSLSLPTLPSTSSFPARRARRTTTRARRKSAREGTARQESRSRRLRTCPRRMSTDSSPHHRTHKKANQPRTLPLRAVMVAITLSSLAFTAVSMRFRLRMSGINQPLRWRASST